MQCSKCYDKPKLKYKKTPFPKSEYNYCSQCGVDIVYAGGYIGCDKCKQYNLCDNCKTCTEGHTLNKVFFLNKFGASLYAQNKYNCDSCGKTKENGPDGVWHCRTCEYDLCNDCVDYDKK